MMRVSVGILFCLLVATGGCVERTLTVQSNPPGALVYLNDQEVGRTPMQRDFKWYGIYDVALRKEGYATLKTTGKVIAPWYEWPPMDLFAELLPLKIKVRPQLTYTLEPAPPVAGNATDLVHRGEEMRDQLESGKYTHIVRPPVATTKRSPATTTVPSTQP